MHSVASNAVAKIFDNEFDNSKFGFALSANTTVTANYTGLLYVIFQQQSFATTSIFEDDNMLLASDMWIQSNAFYQSFTVLIRKGKSYKWRGQSALYNQKFIPFF